MTMKRLTVLGLLFATASASALQPADVQITTDPAVTVKVTRNKTNVSKQISITVNAQDKVTQIKIGAPAPVPAPPPPAPAPIAAPGFIDFAKVPAPRPGSSLYQVKATTELPSPSNDGAFRTVCDFAKMARIDPIVFPGKLDQSHLHTFFGNVAVDENSTTQSLLTTGNSTCRGGISNRSAYWVPTMIDTADGTPIAAEHISVYYKNGFVPGDKVTQGIPEGLRMIAGDPRKSTPAGPGDPFAFRYKCIGGPNASNDQYGSEIPNCDAGAEVWQEIFFPQCWDGTNLDSPDHKSHLSYQKQNQQSPFEWFCPATHPIIIPQISFNVVYKVPTTGAALKWRLSSDTYDMTKRGGYSAHGDWFNGWKHSDSEAWFNGCIKAKKDCHSHLSGDGRMFY